MNGWNPILVGRASGAPSCVGMGREWRFDDGRASAEIVFADEARRFSLIESSDPLVLVLEASAHSGREAGNDYAVSVETGSTIAGSDFAALARAAEAFVESRMPILRAKVRAAQGAT